MYMHIVTHISFMPIYYVCFALFAARMGNPKAALELIIKKLQDVDKVLSCMCIYIGIYTKNFRN